MSLIPLCQNCGFKTGHVTSKAMVRPQDITSLIAANIDDSKPLVTLIVCPTCADTPAGVESENKTHKRLPQFEYEVKE